MVLEGTAPSRAIPPHSHLTIILALCSRQRLAESTQMVETQPRPTPAPRQSRAGKPGSRRGPRSIVWLAAMSLPRSAR